MTALLETPRLAPHVEPLTGLTAWEVCVRLAELRHFVFFDSAQRTQLGRYSYLAADPPTWLTSQRGWIHENGRFIAVADPLTVLARRLADFAVESMDGLPPFQGGAAGLFSYDLCHHIEVL